MGDLLVGTEAGVECLQGGFHLDPVLPVERAVLTHVGSWLRPELARSFLCAEPAAGLARLWLGEGADLEGLAYGEKRLVGDVALSLHPSGRMHGSALVRLERGGEVWVADLGSRRAADPTCTPLETQRCHTLVIDASYGLPVFRWPHIEPEIERILAWWRASREQGRASLLLASATGTAQRVLARLHGGPIVAHAQIADAAGVLARAGVVTAPHCREIPRKERTRALFLAPPSVEASFVRALGPRRSTAMASGWMQVRGARRRRALDRGFALAEHADWDELLAAVAESGASRVLATRGFAAVLARHLRELGLDAQELAVASREKA